MHALWLVLKMKIIFMPLRFKKTNKPIELGVGREIYGEKPLGQNHIIKGIKFFCHCCLYCAKINGESGGLPLFFQSQVIPSFFIFDFLIQINSFASRSFSPREMTKFHLCFHSKKIYV